MEDEIMTYTREKDIGDWDNVNPLQDIQRAAESIEKMQGTQEPFLDCALKQYIDLFYIKQDIDSGLSEILEGFIVER